MRTFAIVIGILLAPALAAADDTEKPPSRTTDVQQMKTDDCARAHKAGKACVLNMGEGETIDGSSPTAGGSAIGIITFGKASSLIHIRRDFITEILKTAEDID
jgi:hypothetical protein